MSHPWMKFYPSDWRSDPALRSCSIGARGLWAEIICVMHEATPYGSLLVNGQKVSEKQLASLAGITQRETISMLGELDLAGVFSRQDDGVIFSRRMRRDYERASRDKANGKLGGNKTLMGVNPPYKLEDKAHIPDTRYQIPERKILNGNGEAKSWTPPAHGRTGQGRIYVEATSEEWKSYAEDYRKARGMDPEPNKHGGRWFRILGEQVSHETLGSDACISNRK